MSPRVFLNVFIPSFNKFVTGVQPYYFVLDLNLDLFFLIKYSNLTQIGVRCRATQFHWGLVL